MTDALIVAPELDLERVVGVPGLAERIRQISRIGIDHLGRPSIPTSTALRLRQLLLAELDDEQRVLADRWMQEVQLQTSDVCTFGPGR